MNKTDIDYGTYDWNPVTGCLRNCPYCFAKDIATRFGGCTLYQMDLEQKNITPVDGSMVFKDKAMIVIDEPLPRITKGGHEVRSSYPIYFNPTFHKYRLNEPYHTKNPGRVLVSFMGDLFGDWVPDEWIRQVFDACEKAPWNKYIFLTKNPERFRYLNITYPENMWFGFTAESQFKLECLAEGARWLPKNSFISIEPICGPLDLELIHIDDKAIVNFLTGRQYYFMAGDNAGKKLKWIIVGAETGNRKEKIIPKREWIESIVDQCRAAGVPIFMKKNLAAIWGEELIQEYPEGLNINF